MIVCGQPSKTSDSATVSTTALKRILTAAEQKNVLEKQVDILVKRILNYQLIIQTLNEKDSLTVLSYEAQIKNIQEVVVIYENELKAVGKQLRKERRKRKWQVFGGIALTGTFVYLYLNK